MAIGTGGHNHSLENFQTTTLLVGSLQLLKGLALLHRGGLCLALVVALVVLIGLPCQYADAGQGAILQCLAAHFPAALGAQHKPQCSAAQKTFYVNATAAFTSGQLVAKVAHYLVYVRSTLAALAGLTALGLVHDLVQH